MTRGGLSIDQKMVDEFVNSTIKNSDDLKTPISLEPLGFDIKVDFVRMREFLSRGLCLDLQRRERGNTNIKMSDIKGALSADDPIEYLRSKGYDSKVLGKLVTK